MLPQGNTQGKRSRLNALPDDHMPASSPPTSPGSPLTYSPQVAMEPIPQQGGPLGRDHAAEFHGVSGWPAQPKLVPTVIVCECPLICADPADPDDATSLYLCDLKRHDPAVHATRQQHKH